MIKKQTVLDQIEITRNGVIQIRLGLELVEDDKILSNKWHRTLIEPAGDIKAQFALVNSHLEMMNEAAVSEADIGKIVMQAAVAWTPEVVTAYQAQLALAAK